MGEAGKIINLGEGGWGWVDVECAGSHENWHGMGDEPSGTSIHLARAAPGSSQRLKSPSRLLATTNTKKNTQPHHTFLSTRSRTSSINSLNRNSSAFHETNLPPWPPRVQIQLSPQGSSNPPNIPAFKTKRPFYGSPSATTFQDPHFVPSQK